MEFTTTSVRRECIRQMHQLAGLPTIVIVSIPSWFWEASCVSKRVDSPKSCAAKTHKYCASQYIFCNGFMQPRAYCTRATQIYRLLTATLACICLASSTFAGLRSRWMRGSPPMSWCKYLKQATMPAMIPRKVTSHRFSSASALVTSALLRSTQVA